MVNRVLSFCYTLVFLCLEQDLSGQHLAAAVSHHDLKFAGFKDELRTVIGEAEHFSGDPEGDLLLLVRGKLHLLESFQFHNRADDAAGQIGTIVIVAPKRQLLFKNYML